MSETKKSLQQLHPLRLDIPILIVLSSVLLFNGFNLPVLTVRKLWERSTFSILTGIDNLWAEKFYFLAIVIFVFSIIFPITKLLALLIVWFVKLTVNHRKNIVHYLEILGRWSMLDVFVAAVLVVSVKLGALADANAEVGIYYFAASILLAMTATTLQNRLIRVS